MAIQYPQHDVDERTTRRTRGTDAGPPGSRLVAAEWRATATGCAEMETTRRLIEARQRPLRGGARIEATAD